jgi:hypothetical protein
MSIWLDFFSLFNDLEPVDQGNENAQAATTRWMELSAAQLATVDYQQCRRITAELPDENELPEDLQDTVSSYTEATKTE